MKVGVIIPAYNVGDQIGRVLSNVIKHVNRQYVIVVNDGSDDHTEHQVSSSDVVLISHSENRGKGEALKTGFKHAISNGFDGIITLDGDGQHDASCIPEFIRIADDSGSDLVLGCRKFELGTMPPDRIFSNWMSSALVSRLAGIKVFDSQCGFRFIHTDVLRTIRLDTSFYEMETELLVKALRMGFKVEFCNVPVIYDDNPSNIKRGLDTWRFCRLYLQLILNRKVNTK